METLCSPYSYRACKFRLARSERLSKFAITRFSCKRSVSIHIYYEVPECFLF